MKLKYKSCIKSFILFILFNILSVITFSNAINSKSQNNKEFPVPLKKSRLATEVNPFISPLDQERGYLIQDYTDKNRRYLRVNQISLSENGGTIMVTKDLEIGGTRSNAFGYNPNNNFIYGIHRGDSKNYLIKLGRSTSSSEMFDFTKTEIKLGLGDNIYIADFDKNGDMYVAGDGDIYKINVTSGSVSDVGSLSSSFADWGYTDAVGTEDRFYFVTDGGDLGYYYKKDGGLKEKLTGKNVGSTLGRVVAVFMDGSDMYIYPSSGKKVYKIDLTSQSPQAKDIGVTIDKSNLSGDAARKYNSPVTELAVQKIVDKTEAKPGEEVIYTLKLQNTSPTRTLTNIVIKDILDQNMSTVFSELRVYEGLTPTGSPIISTVPNSVELTIQTIVSLKAGVEKNYTIIAKIKENYEGNLIKNRFTAKAQEISDLRNSNTVETKILKLNIEKIAKYDDKEIPKDKIFQPGDKIKYTIVLSSNLPDIAYGKYKLYDSLIEENKVNESTYIKLSDIEILSGLTAEQKEGVFKAPGIDIEVPKNGLTITYILTIPELPDGVNSPITISNIVADKKVDVAVDDPKVEVEKTSLEAGKTLKPGEVVNYTITLTNNTTVDFKGYKVLDKLLIDNTYLSLEDVTTPTKVGDALFTASGATVDVPKQGSVVIEYTLTIPAKERLPKLPVTISNIVADKKVDVAVDDPKVEVEKTSLEAGKTLKPGEVVNYTITLTNNTTVDFKGYKVLDKLLIDNTYLSLEDVTTPTKVGDALFTASGATVDVPKQGSVVIEYTLTIPAKERLPKLPVTISNIVADKKVDVAVDDPKVEVEKTSLEAGKTLKPGEVVNYTITLTNNTTVDFKGYKVLDKLLIDNTYLSLEDVTTPTKVGDALFTASGATVDVPKQGSVVIEYTLTIPAKERLPKLPVTISNIVADKKVDVAVDDPKVEVEKTSLEAGKTLKPGEVVNYTITLTNNTTVDFKGYKVLDKLLIDNTYLSLEDVTTPTKVGDALFTASGATVDVPKQGSVVIEYTLTIPAKERLPKLPVTISNIVADKKVDVAVDDPKVEVLKSSDKTGQVVQAGDEITYTLTLTNTGKASANNYIIKDTLLTANTELAKPTNIVVTGEKLEGDIFSETGGSVTVPAGKVVTITYSVTVPENYTNPTILNSVNGGEDIIVEVDKPVVKLRHDVFAYEEKFDNSDELINQDEGIVTDFENIENKNSNPPVILPGNKAIHFISLINPSKVDLKGKSDINHQLDGKQLKDDEGNPAFSEHKFQGIVLTNLDTNEKVFYSEKELNGGQTKAKNTRIARMLPEANELKITPKTSSFTFEEKIPLRTAISFVFSSTVNPEGTFNKNTRISSYAFLPFDSEQNTSEGELRKAIIIIGRREADLVLSKSVEIEEASIGKFVPYTIEIKNMGKDPVDNIIISDKLPLGFTYVDGSAVQELKDGYAQKKLQVIGTKEIEIGPISQIKSGETIVIKYLLKVGVGVKPGTYKNIAVVKNENKENISNTDSIDIDIVADPIFEHTTVIGKVFHDRDRDGIQDYADAKKSHITINIPKEYYVKNTTTVSKDGKTYSFADNYETITIRNIKGRVSELEPATNNMVVIRKELVKPVMANVRVQTFGGTDITQQGNGEVITNHTGDKIKGMTSQDIVVTQRVIKNKDNKIILEIFILNNGIQEEGLPGVRLATPEGIVVETDRFGRYHVPPVPETLGKNYIIKVDPTTLPKGAEFTTENPRVRHLGKVMMKFNFGVKLPPLKNPEKKDN